MNVDLSVDHQAFIEGLVTSGRYSSARDAITEGVRLLISRESLKQQVDVGIQQAAAGELVEHDTVFGQLKAMAAASAERAGS